MTDQRRSLLVAGGALRLAATAGIRQLCAALANATITNITAINKFFMPFPFVLRNNYSDDSIIHPMRSIARPSQ